MPSGSGASEDAEEIALSRRPRSRAAALWLALGIVLSAAAEPARAQETVVQGDPASPAAASPASEGVSERPATGPVVTAIEVRSDAPLDESLDLETLIEIGVGKPLAEEDVRHTLRNLQASGTASEIELYTREDPEGGGVVAVIVFRAVVQVEEVRITGSLGLSRDALRRAVLQAEAEPLSEERVVRGVFGIEDLYESSGYFQGKARVAVQTDERRRRAVVIYTVDSGPRATVSTIAFSQPVAPFQPAALVQQLRIKPGEAYSRRLTREDAERLQDWLVRQHYGAARVDPPLEEVEPASNTVKLTYPIEIGPKISLVVVGADEKALRRKGLLPFLGETGYDEALVLQAVGRLKSYYQEQGYYDVRIDTDQKRTNGELVLTFRIETGPEYTLREIAFEGNEEVSSADLGEVVGTARRSLLRPGSGRLVQAELDKDLENLRRYYALQGYSQAEVGPAQVEKQGRDLRLVIPLREGPRQRVVDLELQGIEALEVDRLRRNLPLRPGGGFHPVLLEGSLDEIRAEYAAQGYTQAQVSARQDWNPDHTLVDVTIEALEGPQQVADRIIVRGNQRTEGDVIRRTLDLDRGEPISEVKLLETERNLYRLGIFSRVEVELVRAGLDTTERDVLIRVEEGKPRTLLYGVGWDSEDGPRGLIGFTDNNVGGRAYSLRTDLRWSVPNKLFRFIFNQPYIFEYPVSLTSTVFYEDETPRDRPFKEVTRYGARAEAVRVFGNRRVSAGLDYRTVELGGVDPNVASNEIERRDQPYQLTSFVPSFFWDRRNDPINPVQGWSSLVQFQYAFPAFETDTEFLKAFLQQTQYWNFSRQGVLAASLRVGGIQPYKTLPAQPDNPLSRFPSRDIPIPERFFAGGDASHRAFSRDDLGIRGETLLPNASGDGFVPVGGNGLLLLNLEYRFPVFGDFGGTVFFDTGNVWPDWRSINLGEVRNGAGIGARYLSPIGPLRAGIGWKLDREPGEPSYELFFNIGNPF
jgi:outer membrane protein insertion porin family